MMTVTVFRGDHFDGAEEIDDYDFPVVPRIGETVSIGDRRDVRFEKVLDVNYHIVNGAARARVLV